MTTLDEVLIANSLISLTIHVMAMGNWLEKRAGEQARRLRNHIIKHHVKSGHTGRLKRCKEGDCPKLRSSAVRLQEIEPGQL